MEIYISNVVRRKLKERHSVSEDKISQCFQNERSRAESAYSGTLNEARVLFSRAIDKGKNPVVLLNAKLRLQQIAELCKQELQPKPAEKNGKTKKAG